MHWMVGINLNMIVKEVGLNVLSSDCELYRIEGNIFLNRHDIPAFLFF